MAPLRLTGDRRSAATTVAFSLLATRRWAGVGVALVVEVAALGALGQLSPSEIVGLPGVIAAAIAGTVAVVFGALDGAVVALAGATAFGFAIGWDTGAVAGLFVWPAVVAVVGLFARRVVGRRAALQHVVTAQERERERVAVELNEQVAQSLSGALMALRAASAAQSEPMLAHARELIQDSIRELRSLAVDLRPKTLDDYGVGAALDGLAESVSKRSGTEVAVDHDGLGRFPPLVELALYRIVEAAVGSAAHNGAERVDLRLRRGTARVTATIEIDGAERIGEEALAVVRERVRLLAGRVTTTAGNRTTTIRADIPA